MPLVGLSTLGAVRRELHRNTYTGGELIVVHPAHQREVRGTIERIAIEMRSNELVVTLHFAGERRLTPEGLPLAGWRRASQLVYGFPLQGDHVITRPERIRHGITFTSGVLNVALITAGQHSTLKESDLKT